MRKLSLRGEKYFAQSPYGSGELAPCSSPMPQPLVTQSHLCPSSSLTESLSIRKERRDFRKEKRGEEELGRGGMLTELRWHPDWGLSGGPALLSSAPVFHQGVGFRGKRRRRHREAQAGGWRNAQARLSHTSRGIRKMKPILTGFWQARERLTSRKGV